MTFEWDKQEQPSKIDLLDCTLHGKDIFYFLMKCVQLDVIRFFFFFFMCINQHLNKCKCTLSNVNVYMCVCLCACV